jgi:quercetin 2,3-dioxygenase
MKTLRLADDRGKTDFEWLYSQHTFSFGDYYDPDFMGFRNLRVINDDIVAAGKGFGTHGHRDMEIISIVLEGAIEHRDSLGHGEVLRPGEVQVMSAGKGIMHSEFNPSESEKLHFLQIWIEPTAKGLTSRYDQKPFAPQERLNRYMRVAGRQNGENDGALMINAAADLYLLRLEAGKKVVFTPQAGKSVWVHNAFGSLALNGMELQAGDGFGSDEEKSLEFTGNAEESEALIFHLG